MSPQSPPIAAPLKDIEHHDDTHLVSVSFQDIMDDDNNGENDTVLDRFLLIHRHADDLKKIGVENATDNDRLAFYRACKGDTIRAQQRLTATMEWRKRNNISGVLQDPVWLSKEKEMRQTLWYDYMGPDQHGRPVLVERVGNWNVGKVLESTRSDNKKEKEVDDADKKENEEVIDDENSTDSEHKMDSFLTLHNMCCETLMTMDRTTKGNNERTDNKVIRDDRGQVIIMDLNGLRPWHLDPRLAKAFGKLAKNDADYYPDTLAHLWVVNAPYTFHALSLLVKPFLDPDTISKFHVSSSVPKELIECVGTECLPEELGGTRTGIFPYNERAPMSDHPRQSQ